MANVPVVHVTIIDIEFYYFPLALLDSKMFQRAFWGGMNRIVDNYMIDNERNINVGLRICRDKFTREPLPLTIYMVCKKNAAFKESLFDQLERLILDDIANHLEDAITMHCTHKHKIVQLFYQPDTIAE